MRSLIAIACIVALSRAQSQYQQVPDQQHKIQQQEQQNHQSPTYPGPQQQSNQQGVYTSPTSYKGVAEDDNSDKDNQYSPSLYTSAQVVDSPNYDPSAYADILPQDVVHQYVSQYGGHYIPGAAIAEYGAAPGFGIQTGYEGFLVPAVVESQNTAVGILDSLKSLFILPKSIFGWIAKLGAFLLTTLGFVLFGGAITTAVCTLTPLCSITFAALPFLQLRDGAEEIGKTIRAELTPERVSRAFEFVQKAIEKFQRMQETSSVKKPSSTQKIEKRKSK